MLEGELSGYTLELRDGLGQLYKQWQTRGTRDRLDLSGLPQGIYFVHILEPNGQVKEMHKVIRM